jgi:hypothetical protein
MSYRQAITHQIVEAMEINVNPTNIDTLTPPEQGSVGDLVAVPDGDDVKDSAGLVTESTSPQHNASISLIDSHESDPPSTAILVMPSSNSYKSLFLLHLQMAGYYHNWRWCHSGK